MVRVAATIGVLVGAGTVNVLMSSAAAWAILDHGSVRIASRAATTLTVVCWLFVSIGESFVEDVVKAVLIASILLLALGTRSPACSVAVVVTAVLAPCANMAVKGIWGHRVL